MLLVRHNSLPNSNSFICSKLPYTFTLESTRASFVQIYEKFINKPVCKVEKFELTCTKNSKSSVRRTREPLPERVSPMFFH